MSTLADLRAAWRQSTPAVLLFAPGNNERRVAKVATCGADGVILDLEDAVPVAEKAETRAVVREATAGMDESILRLVRVNNLSTGWCEEDISVVVGPSVDGLVYPKVEDPQELWEVDRLLHEAERAAGLPAGHTVLVGLVETAVGITRIHEVLAKVPDRLLTLGFGIGDYSVDLEMELGRYESLLDYPRSRITVAARAAGLARPLDGPWLRIKDQDGLAADCSRSHALGFGGRQVVHPEHVAPAARIYLGVSDERVARATRIVEGFEAAVADGSAALQIDGELVDYPIYHRAQRVLAAAERLAHR